MAEVPEYVRDIALVIAVLVMVSAAGWICAESGVMGNYPPETTKFTLQVLVIDANGTLVTNQTVYVAACLQEPAGWRMPTRYVGNRSLSGVTDKDGFAEIETGKYTLSRGDIVWLGASTNRPLLDDDFEARAFNPGSLSKWARFNYSDVRHTAEMNVSGYARFIVVRDSDGRMIDINRFHQESGMSFPPYRLIDAFTYMDNRSWAYP